MDDFSDNKIKQDILDAVARLRSYSRTIKNSELRLLDHVHSLFEHETKSKINRVVVSGLIGSDLKLYITITTTLTKSEVEKVCSNFSDFEITQVQTKQMLNNPASTTPPSKKLKRYIIHSKVNVNIVTPMNGDIDEPLSQFIKLSQKVELLRMAIGDDDE